MSENEINVAKETMAQYSSHKNIQLRTNRWVINRDEKVFLLWLYEDCDPPYDNCFVFGWKGYYMSVKFQKTCKENTCKWELISIGIKEELLDKRKEISKALKDAILCFSIDGIDNSDLEITVNLSI